MNRVEMKLAELLSESLIKAACAECHSASEDDLMFVPVVVLAAFRKAEEEDAGEDARKLAFLDVRAPGFMPQELIIHLLREGMNGAQGTPSPDAQIVERGYGGGVAN